MNHSPIQPWSISIETSTTRGSISLALGVEIKEHVSFQKGLRHGQAIAPFIQEFLEKYSLEPSEIQFISVGIGPGSFTGIRVGLATAKGFAMATKAKIVGVPSLECMALKIKKKRNLTSGYLAILNDARRNRITGGIFKIEKDFLSLEGEYWTDLIENTPSHFPPSCILAGTGTKLLETKEFQILDDLELWIPESKEVAFLGWQKFREKDYLHLETKPLYLMVTEAEEKLAQKKSQN